MKKYTISKITYLINSILFFIAGITIILLKNTYLTLFHLITSILLVNLGFITFILNLIKNNKEKDILVSITTLIVGLFFFNNKFEYGRSEFIRDALCHFSCPRNGQRSI